MHFTMHFSTAIFVFVAIFAAEIFAGGDDVSIIELVDLEPETSTTSTTLTTSGKK